MSEKRRNKIVDRHTRDDEHVQREALRRLLGTMDGRRLVWGLLSESGVFANPHSGNALDSAFRAGMMKVGQDILGRIEMADKRAFLQMQEENIQINESLQAKLSNVEVEEDEYATEED